MATDREIVIAAALVVIFYWWSQSKAEAAKEISSAIQTADNLTYEQSTAKLATGKEYGYIEDTSHIFIRYPGLNIYTPLLSQYVGETIGSDVSSNQQIDVEKYLSNVRGTSQQNTYYPSDLDTEGIIYIAAPKLTVDNATQISAVGPIRILADQLFKNANVDIPKIILNNKFPAEFVSMNHVPGRNGQGSNYYNVYMVKIKYPKNMPEVVSAVNTVLTQQYAYSYDTLKSIYGDI